MWPIAFQDGHEFPAYVQREKLIELMVQMEAADLRKMGQVRLDTTALTVKEKWRCGHSCHVNFVLSQSRNNQQPLFHTKGGLTYRHTFFSCAFLCFGRVVHGSVFFSYSVLTGGFSRFWQRCRIHSLEETC